LGLTKIFLFLHSQTHTQTQTHTLFAQVVKLVDTLL
jgi:hypothetical protein